MLMGPSVHLLALLLTLWSGVRVQGQFVSMGTCPSVSADETATYDEVARSWFQFTGVPTFFDVGTKCIVWQFSSSENFTFQYSAIRDGVPEIRTGSVNASNFPNASSLLLQFIARNTNNTVRVTYRVLYVSKRMLVLYSCRELACLPGHIIQFATVSTSKRGRIKRWELYKALDLIQKTGVPKDRLQKTDNTNCPRDEKAETKADCYRNTWCRKRMARNRRVRKRKNPSRWNRYRSDRGRRYRENDFRQRRDPRRYERYRSRRTYDQ